MRPFVPLDHEALPQVIQGGMGAGVSSWLLARAVSSAGQLGVVSGTGMDVILVRRLQLGDPGGHVRHALEHFPDPLVAQRLLERYFIRGGKAPDAPFRAKPLVNETLSAHLEELLVASNFVEVFLAREGHDRPVGINYLEKIQTPTLPSLYGAMLAGVSVVLMGAGVPRAIPGILDRLAAGEAVELPLDVKGAERGETFVTRFDPATFCGGTAPRLARPDFIAIVSSASLAAMLVRRASGRVDGLVIEGCTAGGHVAPPRGPLRLTREGEPVYGERDAPKLDAIRALDRPFWLAGSRATADEVARARSLGAAGVQVGTAFAFCEESGLTPELKARVLAKSRAGTARAFTDPVASPTGFPFKVVALEGTASQADVAERRRPRCDLGYLREAYRKDDGTVGWRCAAEPVEEHVRKGGTEEATRGKKCICNALMANVGLGQVRDDGSVEQPLVTAGDDVADVIRFVRPGARTYRALDVLEDLLTPPATPDAPPRG